MLLIPAATLALVSLSSWVRASNIPRAAPCDSIEDGYSCRPGISHYWGNYAPWFRVRSSISPDVPKNCEITFVDVLARHAARYPLVANGAQFNALIQKIKSTSKKFTGKYAFLANYVYSLGTESLTPFGEQEAYNLGIQFFDRYTNLLKKYTPFIRASGVPRIIATAQDFATAIHNERIANFGSDPAAYPYPVLVLSEEAGFNNTLGHGTCKDFESTAPYNQTAIQAQLTFAKTFVPAIAARLNADLAPTVFSIAEIIQLMELCPFSTVAAPGGVVSPFCSLFTTDEWHSYDYYNTLGKYYAFGGGNEFGSTQGVGFVNELIARMTNSSVLDNTSTNTTLDSNPATFPVGPDHPVFADFTRDFDITSILFALNLYSDFPLLSNTTIETAAEANGYSSAYTVPFAARVYLEKMQCKGEKEELVRAVVNGRVVPLAQCGADRLGRCGLKAFVTGLKFASSGGRFADCFL